MEVSPPIPPVEVAVDEEATSAEVTGADTNTVRVEVAVPKELVAT